MAVVLSDTRVEESKMELTVATPTARQQLNALRGMTIDSHPLYEMFDAALAHVHAEHKKYKTRLEQITRPSRDSIKSANELFAPILEVLEDTKTAIKEKMQAYQTGLALETEAALSNAAELAANGNADAAIAALATINADGEPEGSAGVRSPWKWDVKDIGLVPRDFVLPNPKAINAEKKRQIDADPDGAPAIAGIHFYREIQIVAGKVAK